MLLEPLAYGEARLARRQAAADAGSGDARGSGCQLHLVAERFIDRPAVGLNAGGGHQAVFQKQRVGDLPSHDLQVDAEWRGDGLVHFLRAVGELAVHSGPAIGSRAMNLPAGREPR